MSLERLKNDDDDQIRFGHVTLYLANVERHTVRALVNAALNLRIP